MSSVPIVEKKSLMGVSVAKNVTHFHKESVKDLLGKSFLKKLRQQILLPLAENMEWLIILLGSGAKLMVCLPGQVTIRNKPQMSVRF